MKAGGRNYVHHFYFRFLKVLVQEFNVMLDKGFLLSVYDIFAHQLPEEETVRSLIILNK